MPSNRESLRGIYKTEHDAKKQIARRICLGHPSKGVVRYLNRSLKQLEKEVNTLEETLTELVNQSHQDLLTRLKSIPGIGPKKAMMLVVLTGGFESLCQRLRIMQLRRAYTSN